MPKKINRERKEENEEILEKFKKHNILPDVSDKQTISIKELQETAKKQGLTGYSKKSKKELAYFIVDSVPPITSVSLLDTPVPTNKDLLTPLTPSKYKHKFVPQSLKSILSKVRVKINSFADWLLSYIPPETKKVVNEKLDSLKNRVSEIYRELNGKKEGTRRDL